MSVRINILASWLAHAVMLAVGFLLMPFILHAVGDSTYGTWLFLNSIAGYAGLLYMGMGDAIGRYTAEHYSRGHWIRLNRVVNCITTVYLGSALIAFLSACVVAAIAPWIHDWPGQSIRDVQLTVLILGANAAISIGGSSFGGLLMGIQRFDVERFIVCSITLLRAIITVVVLNWSPHLVTLALIYLLITVVENLITMIVAFRLVPSLRLRVHFLRKDVFRECFSFSLFAFLALIGEFLIYWTDTIVIGFFLGPLAVVPYYIASRLSEMVRKPLLQVGMVCMPKAGELTALQSDHNLQSLVYRGFGVTLLLSFATLIGAACFGDIMITTWIGKAYAESPGLLFILMLGQLVALPTHLMRNILLGTGYIRLPAILFFVEAICNLCLSLALIPWLGLYGVAIGTLIPLVIIEGCWMLPLALKKFNISFEQLFHRGVAPQLMPMSLISIYCLGIQFLNPQAQWSHVIAIVCGAGLILGTSLWFQEFRPAKTELTTDSFDTAS